MRRRQGHCGLGEQLLPKLWPGGGGGWRPRLWSALLKSKAQLTQGHMASPQQTLGALLTQQGASLVGWATGAGQCWAPCDTALVDREHQQCCKSRQS